jgi:hypothetical protein
VIARRVLEDLRIGIAYSGRTLPDDAALVEQAEQAAAGECALQSAGERRRDRLAQAVRLISARMLSARLLSSSLPVLAKPTSASSAPPKALTKARSVAVAASWLSAT